jgi:UDP-2,3-diacylglucosamine hydrolase
MIEISGTARFISDLHLRAERPDLAGRFFSFLDDTATRPIEALFILGDLFEYWIGDDDMDDPFNRSVADALACCVKYGTTVYFLAGNRDFLLGQSFAQASGIKVLAGDAKVGAGGTATLLLHGDTLCTDDQPYQEFRRMVRAPEWQQKFLSRPIDERRAEVAALRQRSTEAMRGKTAAIMDVNPLTVQETLSASRCQRMIHGHTHRPGMEAITLGQHQAERWVLSDWDHQRGDAIEMNASGIRRLDLSA